MQFTHWTEVVSIFHPVWVAQLVGGSSCPRKGCRFDPWSGLVWEATDCCFSLTWCFSLSLLVSLSSTLCKINKHPQEKIKIIIIIIIIIFSGRFFLNQRDLDFHFYIQWHRLSPRSHAGGPGRHDAEWNMSDRRDQYCTVCLNGIQIGGGCQGQRWGRWKKRKDVSVRL